MRWKKLLVRDTAADPPANQKNLSLLLQIRNDFSAILEPAVKSAAERAGYTLNAVNAYASPGLQLEQLRGAKRRGEEAVIVNLADPVHPQDILEEAGDMKVVFLNHVPADLSVLKKNAIFVGPNDEKIGKIQGDWLVKYFKDKGQNQIKYILLQGIPDWPTTILRSKFAVQALADGGLQATLAAPPVVADYDFDEARMKMIKLLNSGIQFDAIISNNDEMTLGAIEAFENLGMDPSKVAIVSVNATPATMEALREKKLSMTVFQDVRAQGSVAIAAITNMLAGKPFDQGLGFAVSSDNPYVVYVPLDVVSKTHIPPKLYFEDLKTHLPFQT